MYLGRKEVADADGEKKKGERNGAKVRAKGGKRGRRTVSRRDARVKDSPLGSRRGTKSRPQQVQQKSSADVTRIDNDLLPIERDTADRSPSILLDRENPARRGRGRRRQDADGVPRRSLGPGPEEGCSRQRGVDSLLSSRSPTLARELPVVGRLEDPPVNARNETGGIDSDYDGDDDGDDDDGETVLQGTHR